jgi:hypothetical protein
MSPARQEQIIAYYVAGWPLTIIAATLGLSMSEVRKALTERNPR